MEDINIDMLGEFGQSIKNFNIDNFKQNFLESSKRALDAYKKDYQMYKELGQLDQHPLIIKYIEYLEKVLNDETFFNEMTSWHLNAQVRNIIQYLQSQRYALNEPGMAIPKLSFYDYAHDLDKPIIYPGGMSSTVKEAIKSVPFDKMRELLFNAAGLKFTSMEELKDIISNATPEQKSEVVSLLHKNGFSGVLEDGKFAISDLQDPGFLYADIGRSFDEIKEICHNSINETNLIDGLSR